MTPTSSRDHMKLADHDHHQLQLFNIKTIPSSSTISTIVLTYSNPQDQGSCFPREAQKVNYQQEVHKEILAFDHAFWFSISFLS